MATGAKAGKPFARLMPLQDLEKRTPGRYEESIPSTFFEDLPEDELAGRSVVIPRGREGLVTIFLKHWVRIWIPS